MSKKSRKKAGIKNASEIIERFGGIRPMAGKIDVAVTTVQGWKKRNTIPGARRKMILEAAQAHDIDLSDILAEASNDDQASASIFVSKTDTNQDSSVFSIEFK